MSFRLSSRLCGIQIHMFLGKKMKDEELKNTSEVKFNARSIHDLNQWGFIPNI